MTWERRGNALGKRDGYDVKEEGGNALVRRGNDRRRDGNGLGKGTALTSKKGADWPGKGVEQGVQPGGEYFRAKFGGRLPLGGAKCLTP